MKRIFTAVVILICSFSLAHAQVPSYVPTNGLVGWWPFNGNANDESGNGNNGVVTGATLAADRFGNSNLAYSLNGVNDFITIDSLRNYNFNSQITISAWFNSNSIQQKKNIVTKYGGFVDAFSLDIKPSQIEYNVSPGSANWSTCSNNTINLGFNSWHNVTATYDFANNLFKIYFDGIIVGTKNASSLLGQASNVPVIFGYFYDPNNTIPSQHFDGDIDDIGIWNRALDSAEIASLYNVNATGYEKLTSETLVVYPNPASTILTVNNNSAIKEANILSIDGRFIQKTILTVGKNTIDITSIENGIYILKVGDKVSKFSVVH